MPLLMADAGRPIETASRILSTDGFEVCVDFLPTEQRRPLVLELESTGVPVPLQHRPRWSRTFHDDSWFVSIRRNSATVYGFAVRVLASRALPGHRILRVDKFGAMRDPRHAAISLRGLKELALSQPRVLRLYVDVFSRDSEVRRRIGQIAQELGYQVSADPRCYLHTVALDLRRSEDEIFAGVHATARRHIRAPAKRGYEVRPIVDERFAPRVAELLHESMQRTAGPGNSINWSDQIAFGRDNPRLARLIGTFDPGVEGPSSLLGFALGEFHGDYVSYSHAACTRQTDTNVALTYAPTWELICWAKEVGATWFDFGGIPGDGDVDAEKLQGISDFKRYFSNEVVRVGDEWLFEPHPKRALVARTLSTAASRLRKVFAPG